MSADYYSASASNTYVNLDARDRTVSTNISCDPLGKLDYVYQRCLGALLRDNGFKGKFFKKATGEGCIVGLLYCLYLLCWVGSIGLVIAWANAINDSDLEQYANIFQISWIGCTGYVELWLFRGIIVYFQNRKLANAVFHLLTKQTGESLGNFTNRFYEVTLTATEIGVKMNALRAALRTESGDIEITAGRIQAGVNQSSLKVHLMLYQKSWIEKYYYSIFYFFVVFSAFFLGVLYYMFYVCTTCSLSL